MRASSCLALALAVTACAHREPPQWDAGSLGVSAVPLPGAPPPSLTAQAAAAIADAGGDDARPSDAAVSAASTVDAGRPIEDDAGALPQTHEQPQPSGPRFEAGVAALWDAIVSDDAERAMPFFFPLSAYEQVKAIGNPARDWKLRLVAAYKRDIHDLHIKLGPRVSRAKFVRADVPMARSRWVDPGEEYNRIGYYRVFGTKLRGEIDGRAVSVEVTSLISWRGEWYCVHLTGVR